MSSAGEFCCLCGLTAKVDDPITREHVPPKQFYPKAIRNGLNLWIVPTHRSCNNNHKADEEYFYHSLYPLVANENPVVAGLVFDDLKRRAEKPQTRSLLKSMLNTSEAVTVGGLLLPPGVVRMSADEYRIQQVALKIGRCLFYRDHLRFMPSVNCKDMRLCEREDDVPELYRLSWEMSKVNVNDLTPNTPGGLVLPASENEGLPLAALQQVFSYRAAYFAEKQLHLYSLFFWQAFWFCMAFEDTMPTE